MDWHAIPVEGEVLAFIVNHVYKHFKDTNNWKNCGEHWLNFLALEIFNLKNDKQWKSEGICDGV